jgi:hypothetical protein
MNAQLILSPSPPWPCGWAPVRGAVRPLRQMRRHRTIRSGPRRVKVCPRCKGRRRVQRRGSRTIHRLVFGIRDGQRAAAKYTQEDSDGDS